MARKITYLYTAYTRLIADVETKHNETKFIDIENITVVARGKGLRIR